MLEVYAFAELFETERAARESRLRRSSGWGGGDPTRHRDRRPATGRLGGRVRRHLARVMLALADRLQPAAALAPRGVADPTPNGVLRRA